MFPSLTFCLDWICVSVLFYVQAAHLHLRPFKQTVLQRRCRWWDIKGLLWPLRICVSGGMATSSYSQQCCSEFSKKRNWGHSRVLLWFHYFLGISIHSFGVLFSPLSSGLTEVRKCSRHLLSCILGGPRPLSSEGRRHYFQTRNCQGWGR